MPVMTVKEVNKFLKSDIGATKMKSKPVERNELRLKKFFMQWCPDIKDIIFSKPATICILKDGRKGVVKVRHGDSWSAEKGMLYAYIKAIKVNVKWTYEFHSLDSITPFGVMDWTKAV